jgi:hypothetical protein
LALPPFAWTVACVTSSYRIIDASLPRQTFCMFQSLVFRSSTSVGCEGEFYPDGLLTAVCSSFASLPPFHLLANIPPRVIHTRQVLGLNVGWEQVTVNPQAHVCVGPDVQVRSDVLLGCDVVKSGRCSLTFRMAVLHPSSLPMAQNTFALKD